MTPPVTPAPVNSVAGIEQLILFGLEVLSQVLPLFLHPTNPVPVSAAPAIIQHLQSTPGASSEHKDIINSAVNTAVTISQTK